MGGLGDTEHADTGDDEEEREHPARGGDEPRVEQPRALPEPERRQQHDEAVQHGQAQVHEDHTGYQVLEAPPRHAQAPGHRRCSWNKGQKQSTQRHVHKRTWRVDRSEVSCSTGSSACAREAEQEVLHSRQEIASAWSYCRMWLTLMAALSRSVFCCCFLCLRHSVDRAVFVVFFFGNVVNPLNTAIHQTNSWLI